MNDYLSNISFKLLDKAKVIQPRLQSMFEPVHSLGGEFFEQSVNDGLEEKLEFESEQTHMNNDEVSIQRLPGRLDRPQNEFRGQMIVPPVNNDPEKSIASIFIEDEYEKTDDQIDSGSKTKSNHSVLSGKTIENKSVQPQNIEVSNPKPTTAKKSESMMDKPETQNAKTMPQKIEENYRASDKVIIQPKLVERAIVNKNKPQEVITSEKVIIPGEAITNNKFPIKQEKQSSNQDKTSDTTLMSEKKKIVDDHLPQQSHSVLSTKVIEPKVVKYMEPAKQAPPLTKVIVEKKTPEPVINVTIGRVEVKAISPPQTKKREKSRPSVMSLEEYLKRRANGDR